MIHLHVWITLPDGRQFLVGELVASDADDLNGAIEGEFRYADEYLSWSEAFPLDPRALPLRDDIFKADRPRSGIHGVFEDALPDAWGRRLLVHRHGLLSREQRPPFLLRHLSGIGMGALHFCDEPSTSPAPPASAHSVEALMEAAMAFDAGERLIGNELALLFEAGSSPGGARPKALVEDNEGSWLAKFASLRDRFDVVRLEAATLTLAQHAGMESPELRLLSFGEKSVLLVRRFDVTEANGRRHMLSLQTLLQADGYYSLGYTDVGQMLRRYCASPSEDLARLYRQMVFNALIGNTDDHLKNLALLHDSGGYRLSPAYDLTPNIGENREHVLRFGPNAWPPERSQLLQLANSFNLRTEAAGDIIDEVCLAVARWREVFDEFQVPERDCQRLAPDINGRLKKID